MGWCAPTQYDLVQVVLAGGAFSIQAPRDWEHRELNLLQQHHSYEYDLFAPGAKGLAYSRIGVKYFADPHRSIERYLFDQLNPEHSPPNDVRGDVRDFAAIGHGAKRFEIRSVRRPPLDMKEQEIHVIQHHVVIPMNLGFVVLVLDVPQALADQYAAVFDQVVKSFHPAVALPATVRTEITDEEYQVFTDYFSAASSKTSTDLPSGLAVNPQEIRVVHGFTSAAGRLDEKNREKLRQMLDTLESDLVKDFKAKSAQQAIIRDRIMVRGLTIVADREKEQITGERILNERMRSKNPNSLNRSIAYLSRVGFDQRKETALFHVGAVDGGPIIRYFVLMKKIDGKWAISKTVMTDFIIL